MKIEQMKKLSDMELGRQLAEIAGWKVIKDKGFKDVYYYQCKIASPAPNQTRFICHDLNLIAEIEKIVIEKGLAHEYGKELLNLTDRLSNLLYCCTTIATITARQKAEVLLSLLEEKE